MAKKKGASRIITGIAGIGVLIAVIIPVMFFVFGVGNADVLPQETDPEPFEVPIACLEGQIRTPEGTCIADITPIIEEPELFCEIPQSELQKIAECELLTQDEQTVPLDPNLPVDECSQVNRPSAEICDAEIDQIIQQLLENAEPIIDPVPPNGTETSVDDPFTQICDQDPTLIVCGESRSLEFITRVLKTDSAGVQTSVETITDILQLELFAEDTTNIDFRTGQLQFEVQIKGDPDFRYMGTGKVDLLVGDQSLFLEPLNVRVDGIANEEGKVDLLFISPTGATSDLILFNFADNFDKFINEVTTPIRLHVVELNIAGERDQDFALINQDVFTMDIFRDDIQILITDEQGIESRVYPSDSRLIIRPKTSVSEPALVGTTRIQIFDSIFLGNGRGCTQFQLISDRSFTLTATATTTVPAPSLTGISILDSENNIVTTGSGFFDYNQLTRNQNYTINISQQNIKSSELDYGKSQETKSYICTQEGQATTSTTRTQSGSTAICGYYQLTTRVSVSGVTVTPNSISCNFPQETP
jgi:hypothetical protein